VDFGNRSPLAPPAASYLARHWLLPLRATGCWQQDIPVQLNCSNAPVQFNCSTASPHQPTIFLRAPGCWQQDIPSAGWGVLANNLLARSWLLATVELPLQISGFRLFVRCSNFEFVVLPVSDFFANF
jgi:hypothetical protein